MYTIAKQTMWRWGWSLVLLLSGTVVTCYAQMPALPSADVMEEALLTKLQERMDLTATQVEELQPIVADHVAEQRKLMEDPPKSMRGKRKLGKRMKSLQGETDKRIQALLTADQTEAYKGFWDEQRDAFRKRMKEQ